MDSMAQGRNERDAGTVRSWKAPLREQSSTRLGGMELKDNLRSILTALILTMPGFVNAC